MNYLARFQKRVMVDDGYGNHVGHREDRFTRWCSVRFLRGGEAVMAARLASKQPVILTIRRDPDTEAITPSWQFLISGRAYDIKENPRPSDDRQFFELLAESGG